MSSSICLQCLRAAPTCDFRHSIGRSGVLIQQASLSIGRLACTYHPNRTLGAALAKAKGTETHLTHLAPARTHLLGQSRALVAWPLLDGSSTCDCSSCSFRTSRAKSVAVFVNAESFSERAMIVLGSTCLQQPTIEFRLRSQVLRNLNLNEHGSPVPRSPRQQHRQPNLKYSQRKLSDTGTVSVGLCFEGFLQTTLLLEPTEQCWPLMAGSCLFPFG